MTLINHTSKVMPKISKRCEYQKKEGLNPAAEIHVKNQFIISPLGIFALSSLFFSFCFNSPAWHRDCFFTATIALLLLIYCLHMPRLGLGYGNG